ncbi:MAG: hypothetical protein D6771_05885, partial [Zetaproteobacteria bacterium]
MGAWLDVQIVRVSEALGLPYPAAAIALFLAATFVLWVARPRAQAFLESLLEELARLLDVAAAHLRSRAQTMRERALALAAEYFLRNREWEILKQREKLEEIVARDLEDYPNMHQRLTELMEDYERHLDEAAKPVHVRLPEQLAQVDARIEQAYRKGKPWLVVRALVCLRRGILRHGKRLLRFAKKQARARHRALVRLRKPINGMVAVLKRLEGAVSDLKHTVARSEELYEEMRALLADQDELQRAASHSILTEFLLALLFFGLAVGGSVVN